MNTKKKLDAYAQKDLSEYENKQFLESLKEKVSENSTGQRRLSFRKILALSLIAFAVLVVSIGIFLWAPWENAEQTALKNDDPIERLYLLEDEKTIDISWQELNEQTEEIKFSSENLIRVSKVENTNYNEILYYILYYDCSDFDNIKIVFCNNALYKYDFNHTPYNQEATIIGNKLQYVESYSEDDGIYIFETRAELNLDSSNMYIEYSGIGVESTSNFIDLLSSILNN